MHLLAERCQFGVARSERLPGGCQLARNARGGRLPGRGLGLLRVQPLVQPLLQQITRITLTFIAGTALVTADSTPSPSKCDIQFACSAGRGCALG